mmetsp:Transcript_4743/g.13267  ORF Transcript_4743/g.13267 Transcript_4743/m.13267 type:complete len:172 (-) Transcript_4743:2209-2724(-)
MKIQLISGIADIIGDVFVEGVASCSDAQPESQEIVDENIVQYLKHSYVKFTDDEYAEATTARQGLISSLQKICDDLLPKPSDRLPSVTMTPTINVKLAKTVEDLKPFEHKSWACNCDTLWSSLHQTMQRSQTTVSLRIWTIEHNEDWSVGRKASEVCSAKAERADWKPPEL